MNPFRILILSSVRPSRAWRMASRLMRELSGAEVCGIVQRPVERLPLTQQLVIDGGVGPISHSSPALFKAKVWFCSLAERLIDWALWCIHGCRQQNASMQKFTVDRLAAECMRVGWPFLLAENVREAKALEFCRQRSINLIVVLGELPLSPELLLIPERGTMRASQTEECRTHGLNIRLEHIARDRQTPVAITALTLPAQPCDGLLSLTLKADLITDDLLVESARNLQAGDMMQMSEGIKEWTSRIWFPYIRELERASVKNPAGRLRQRCRPVWKLCLETMLLCCPFIVLRNWYRSRRGCYPLIILAHHLVTDRVHRMGIPTETFWRQVRFLQKHYRIVSLSEGVELLRSGTVEVPCIALTFDDGYADNFVSLRAVAEETGIPAAVFVATKPVENHQEFQHDLEKGIRGFFPLTWDQIRYWSRGGTEFGSHTQSHFDCGSRDRKKLEDEIVGSKNLLERRLKQPLTFFAFPFGGRCNISPEAMELAASAYAHVLSDFGGENLPESGISRRHLLRKNAYLDLWELVLELQSVFDLMVATKRPFFVARTKLSGLLTRLRATSFFTAARNASPHR